MHKATIGCRSSSSLSKEKLENSLTGKASFSCIAV